MGKTFRSSLPKPSHLLWLSFHCMTVNFHQEKQLSLSSSPSSAHQVHTHPCSPSSRSLLCFPPFPLPQVKAWWKSLPAETCYPKMALSLLARAFPTLWLRFGFSRVSVQLLVEFRLPSVPSRESMWKNKEWLGLTHMH